MRSRAKTLLVVLAFLAGSFVSPAPAEPAPRQDPIISLVRRIERFLRRHEVDGVTMDWRYQVNPSEEIRQTVVCQVLAYAELYRLKPTPRLRREIVEHADFMLGRLEEIRSHTPFDGMLAYALFAAYETSGETRFLTAARGMGDELLAIPTSQCVLNGGLMVAMAAALDARLTGNGIAAQKTADILVQLGSYQNSDGSFPHWCPGSRDIHYTGWMAMELIHIARLTNDPTIEPMLGRMTAFLEGRIAPDGRAIYEEPCPDRPDCTLYYDSRRSGCDFDYDTRGWTVEPAYCALLFDRQGSPKYEPVVRFLDALENDGRFADLYGYWPPPEDPEYPWTIADTSVVNMSVIFWALSTTLTERERRGEAIALELFDEDGLAPERPARLRVSPNPARGACALSFTLPGDSPVALAIYDAVGRHVRRLEPALRSAGEWSAAWDGRDSAGREVPSGAYFARLRAGGTETTARVIQIDTAGARP